MSTDDSFAEQVQQLTARAQIYDAVMRYARGVDRCDKEAIVSAFHPGATVDYTTFTGSPEEFADWVIQMHLNAFTWTTHLNVNHLVEFRGDRAVGETYVQATLRFEKEGRLFDLHGFGRYFDQYELRDGKWLITFRRAIVDTERTVRVPSENKTELVAAIGNPGTRDRNDLSYDHFAKIHA
jgi:SnoaL-like domain